MQGRVEKKEAVQLGNHCQNFQFLHQTQPTYMVGNHSEGGGLYGGQGINFPAVVQSQLTSNSKFFFLEFNGLNMFLVF